MPLDFHPSTQTASERLAEANRILDILINEGVTGTMMEPHEARFVENMTDNSACSPAQLDWLRRLKDKYL